MSGKGGGAARSPLKNISTRPLRVGRVLGWRFAARPWLPAKFPLSFPIPRSYSAPSSLAGLFVFPPKLGPSSVFHGIGDRLKNTNVLFGYLRYGWYDEVSYLQEEAGWWTWFTGNSPAFECGMQNEPNKLPLETTGPS